MKNEIIEEIELIAQRVPPGDKWELLIDKENVIEGLVQTLNQYVRKTKFKGHYRLEPLNGKLFAIVTKEVPIEEPEPEKFDLYGEM
jgi:hypothetical protein